MTHLPLSIAVILMATGGSLSFSDRRSVNFVYAEVQSKVCTTLRNINTPYNAKKHLCAVNRTQNNGHF